MSRILIPVKTITMKIIRCYKNNIKTSAASIGLSVFTEYNNSNIVVIIVVVIVVIIVVLCRIWSIYVER